MESKERAGGCPHALHATQVPSSYSCAGWACGGSGEGKEEAGSGQGDSPGMDIFKDHCLAV